MEEFTALAGADGADEALSEAEAAGVLESARGRYRFPHALMREELAARLPEETLRRTHADAAASARRGRRASRGVAHHLLRAGRARTPSRSSRGRPSGPRAWAPTATVPSGPSWRSLHADESERPALLALRAQLLHGAGEAHAPVAYAEAIEVAPAERVPALRAQQARACLAGGDIQGAKAALEGVEAERPEDVSDLILLRGMVAWHTGDWEGARRLAAEAADLAPDPAELADLKGMIAHLDGGWEQHARRQLTQVWDVARAGGPRLRRAPVRDRVRAHGG